MKIRDLRRVFIYHSPQYPGYTCWCGLWNMPDESVMCCFTQATGPFTGRPRAPMDVQKALDWPPPSQRDSEFGITGNSYDMTGLDLQNVHLRSYDFGNTWKVVSGDHFKSCMNGISGQPETALSDGTILRAVWGFYLPYNDVPENGYMQRSTDGSVTWSEPRVIYDNEGYMFLPKRIKVLKDGRILVGGGLARRHEENWTRYGWFEDSGAAFFVSRDNGISWSGPINAGSKEEMQEYEISEEFDWAELDNGDLLLIIRAGVKHGRLQTRLIKKEDSWETTRIEKTVMPYSGNPALLMTREGIVFHAATTGISFTGDEGKTWEDVVLGDGLTELRKERATGYYPKSIQMANGEVLIVGHVGGDNGYGQVDQSIIGVRFFVEV